MLFQPIKLALSALVRALPPRLRRFLARLLTKDIATEIVKLWIDRRRDTLAAFYLKGEGIEIGALNRPLPVPEGVRVRYVDCLPYEKLRATYSELQGIQIQAPDIIDDGEKLSTLAAESQDFVIANHFLEHCQDPIGTIKNFLRVLKEGGVIFLALPDKRWTFDVDREPTPFHHVLKDFREGPEWSHRDHFRDVFRHLGGLRDPEEIERQVDFKMRKRVHTHTHYHVWRQEDMLEFLARLKTDVGFDIEIEAYVSHMSEGIIVLRKGESLHAARQQAEESLRQIRAADAAPRRASPSPSHGTLKETPSKLE